MKGMILTYRRGKNTQDTNQVLVKVEGVENREQAEKMVGKALVWKTPGDREIKGKITAVHGAKGVLRAKFDRNLPGQSFKTTVEVA
ncbi:50S ribosomal protein L35ae [Candidatus Micrarchaeota archaeon RBG_16_49_10]|nr:MAG: 50S ribosomal protein L35ae [Candidatus Micrarchaeota archaeon RBG_16_49_10]